MLALDVWARYAAGASGERDGCWNKGRRYREGMRYRGCVEGLVAVEEPACRTAPENTANQGLAGSRGRSTSPIRALCPIRSLPRRPSRSGPA
ncbi:hypothetical protein NITHO_2000009 [Nitrolancea hollandica Lb]|uniref:Uncharacterized protein n=1 Tax=Nitrolancea hollandica Lb TaxID=1129897 RepID=I4EET6_9BACT|nr:hypothetical protein NITHO_2000009 [Nitrolancea hollandica Lb]